MKKILVPIDFSKCSKGAFIYAKALADTFGFSLKVVHIYSGNLDSRESVVLLPGKTRHETVVERMNDFVKIDIKHKSDSGILVKQKIETEAVLAFSTTHQILKMTKDPEIAMVVIGTTGAGNIVGKMFGSISSAVAQRAHRPVLLVPEGLEFQAYQNVLYASNYESADENMVQQIIDFGNIFRATMHFVHVEEQDNYETVEDTIFYKLFEKGDPAFSFNIVNLKNRSVMEGLVQYAEENDVDLMVLVNRQRSYLENIFQLSLTKKMARNTKLPLLVFHLMNE